jgi:hypothetical protein
MDGGHSILLSYAAIKVITDRYSPEIIILEFTPSNIVRYAGDYDRLEILLPYYRAYPGIRDIIQLRGPLEKYKLLSAIYPFNSNIIDIIRFNTTGFAGRILDYNGYVPLKEKRMKTGKQKTTSGVATQSVVDTNKVNALKNIIRICREKNISLFIFNSPTYHNVNEIQSPPSPEAELALEIILKNKVNYVDFSSDPLYAGHLDWYRDQLHLNENGASKYSQQIGELINKNKTAITDLH